MCDKYRVLKHTYGSLLDDDYNLPEINIINCKETENISPKEYINSLVEKFHVEYNCNKAREQSIALLDISQAKFGDLILETICSNLYLDLIVIVQQLEPKNSPYTHEQFLRKATDFFSNGHKCNERFRRRMGSQRLGLFKKLKYKGQYPYEGAPSYYIPTLAQFYKETLLLKREGTNIFDISKYFVDIFKFLMFEKDKDNKYNRSKRLIKEFRLWEISKDEVDFIKRMYQSINSTETYSEEKFAEFLLLEKSFGLLTASSIAEIELEDTDYQRLITLAFDMRRFAFSSFHEVYFSSINQKNVVYYVNMMQKYILPLWDEVYTALLKEILCFVINSESKNKIAYIHRLIKVCRDMTHTEVFENNLPYINGTFNICSPELIKRVCGVPLNISDKRIHNYISFYEYYHIADDINSTDRTSKSKTDCTLDKAEQDFENYDDILDIYSWCDFPDDIETDSDAIEIKFEFAEGYYNKKYESKDCKIIDRQFLSFTLSDEVFCCDDLPEYEEDDDEDDKKSNKIKRIEY